MSQVAQPEAGGASVSRFPVGARWRGWPVDLFMSSLITVFGIKPLRFGECLLPQHILACPMVWYLVAYVCGWKLHGKVGSIIY